MIEIISFRLAPGADEQRFMEADRQLQSDFAYQQSGLRRRTTARSDDGHWIVINLWLSDHDADVATARWGQDPVTAAFMAFVDEATVETRRYSTLD